MSEYEGKHTPPPATEQATVLTIFGLMLESATGDGSIKRKAGTKPPWWRDLAHEPALFSHLNKWKHGERVDHDSGVHPLVHLAWRALAIAYQETYGLVDPDMSRDMGHDIVRRQATAHVYDKNGDMLECAHEWIRRRDGSWCGVCGETRYGVFL